MSVEKAIAAAGVAKIARAHGISKTAVCKWKSLGRLPHTEHLPDGHPQSTKYWQTIKKLAALNGYRISKVALLHQHGTNK